MKIVYFCNSIQNGGGIERIVIAKANHLCENNEVYVVTTRHKAKEYFFPLNEKVKHIDFSEYGRDKKLLFGIGKLRSILGEIKPDIIIAITGKESFILPFIDRKTPKIKELHFSRNYRKIQHQNAKSMKKMLFTLIDKIELKIYSMYDVVTPLTYEDQKEWPLDNTEVIYNFKTIDSDYVSKLDSKVVMSVGRLDYQKGYDLLLQAWQIVHQVFPDWKLTIYGSGTKKEELQDLAKTLGIEESVMIYDHEKKIKEKYLESAIYVMSSRHEGFPLVLLEAMECGLSVVSFACPCGPSEILDDGISGLLVENGNIEVLAEKLVMLMKDKKKRKMMGKEAKAKVQQFDQEKIMQQWRALISHVIQKRGNHAR